MTDKKTYPSGIQRDGVKSPDNNIASMLDGVASRVGGRQALVHKNGSVTFDELLDRVKQCANLLTRHGLEPGERVIVMIPMSVDLYVALLAIIRCGAVAVFVDPWIPIKQIADFAAFAEPSGFIGIPKSHFLRLLNRDLASLKISVTTGAALLGVPARHSLREISRHTTEHDAEPVAKDAPALITFTSGSSGIPKGANRTHAFLTAQYEALCGELRFSNDDIDMPMFPVFALRNLAAGITSVIPDMDFKNVAEIEPHTINRQLEDNEVTVVTASPPFIDRLAALETPYQPRRIITGGAPVTGKQLRKWKKAFPNSKIEIVYGSTEAEPVALVSANERLSLENELGYCCGKPTTLVKTRIVKITKSRIAPKDLSRITLSQGEIGELLVAGKHVCRSYFNNEEAVRDNKVLESDGACWHRMGDTGYFDDAGRFFLTGRVHSTIFRDEDVLHAQLVEDEYAKSYPDAERVAALEMDGKLVVALQMPESAPEGSPPSPVPPPSVKADKIIATRRGFPLDPRHNSKIDYDALRRHIQRETL